MKRTAFLAAALLASSPAFAVDVLIVSASGYVSDVQSKLIGTAQFTTVDLWDATTSTPTFGDLLQYDAVMVVADGGFLDRNLLGDNLADYVDAGGGVLEDIFVFTQQYGGRFYSGGYGALITTNAYSGPEAVVSWNASPITAGVNAFTGSSFHSPDAVLAPGAASAGTYASGVSVLGYATRGAGTVASLNEYSPSSDIRGDFWDATTDGTRLMANALLFVAGDFFRSSATGTCGGAVTIATTYATPGGAIAYVTGTPGGTAVVPSGPCAGLTLPLGAPRLRATRTANGGGNDTINIPALNPAFCGASYVAVDLATCSIAPGTLP